MLDHFYRPAERTGDALAACLDCGETPATPGFGPRHEKAVLREPFSTTRDEAHPVRWSPADGDTPAYLTLKGAVERLTGYGYDPVEVRAGLLAHRPYRTPFAFYMIDED